MSNNGLAGAVGSVKVELTRNTDVKLSRVRYGRAASRILAGSLVAYDNGIVYPLNFLPAGTTNSRFSNVVVGQELSFSPIVTDTTAASFADGSFVYFWADNVASLNPTFARFSASGLMIQSPVIVQAVSSSGNRVAVSQGNQNFILVYVNNTTGSNPTFSIFNSLGKKVLGPIAIQAVGSTSSDVSTNPTNTEFTIAYSDVTNTQVRFARYSAAGVLQGAITTVASVSSGIVRIAYSPNGEFVVAYANATNTRIDFARYNSAGVLQGAITIVAVVSSNALDIDYGPNGDFVISYQDATNGNNPKFARFNSAGVQQGAITTVAAVSATNNSVSYSPNGDFVISYTVAGQPTVARYNALGVLIDAPRTFATTSSPVTSFTSPDGTFGLAFPGNTSSSLSFRHVSYYPTNYNPIIIGYSISNANPNELVKIQRVGAVANGNTSVVNHKQFGGSDVTTVANLSSLS